MMRPLHWIGAAAMLLATGLAASAEQVVLKLDRPLGAISPGLQKALKLAEVERFEADGASFVVLDVENEAYLETFLNTMGVTPLRVSTVEFVNSPVVGGGEMAPADARDGHLTFVIERPIPGVGGFPLAKKEAISRASNAAMAEMEGRVEWVHSYLTDEGTFCIYRASDEDQIVEHAGRAGAPLGPITAVTPSVEQ